MKKIIRGLLAIILLFTLTLNVKAVEITTDNTKQGTTDTNSYLVTNTGTLTVTNVGGDILIPHKILDYYYNSTTNSLSYEFTNYFKTFLDSSTEYKNLTVEQYRNLTSGNITSGSTQTESTLDILVSQYTNYLVTNNIIFDGENGDSLITTEAQSIASDELPVGSYLILPSVNIKNSVYAVMVGNIDLEYDNNEWTVKNATIVAKKSPSNIIREIIGTTKVGDKHYMKIGEEFTNRITYTVPEMPTNSTNTKVAIYEELLSGIEGTSTIDSIIIKDGNNVLTIKDVREVVDSTVYRAKITDSDNHEVGEIEYQVKAYFDAESNGTNHADLKVVLDTKYIKSDIVTIEYKTKLNDDAGVGKNGNMIDIFVSASPYGDEETANFVYAGNAIIYSYGIKINTKDKSNNNLTGAQYKLYSDSGLNEEIGTFVSNGTENTVTGLAPGTYYVKQVTAPNGSSTLNTETFTVNVDESQEGYVTLDVTNSGVGLLPVTGGAGTIAFIVVGLLVVIAAFAYYVVRNKKKINNVV